MSDAMKVIKLIVYPFYILPLLVAVGVAGGIDNKAGIPFFGTVIDQEALVDLLNPFAGF